MQTNITAPANQLATIEDKIKSAELENVKNVSD